MEGGPYAFDLQVEFVRTFQGLGGFITFQSEVTRGSADMSQLLISAGNSSPDVFYFPIFEPEGPLVVAQSSDFTGFENTTFMAADGLLTQSFPVAAGPNAQGMLLTGTYVSGAGYDLFLNKWQSKYGNVPPSAFHAFAYDAANILFDAIEAVAIVEADGTLIIGRQALREALTNTTEFKGLTGTLTCTRYGDCASGESLAIFQISDAEIQGTSWPPVVVYSP